MRRSEGVDIDSEEMGVGGLECILVPLYLFSSALACVVLSCWQYRQVGIGSAVFGDAVALVACWVLC